MKYFKFDFEKTVRIIQGLGLVTFAASCLFSWGFYPALAAGITFSCGKLLSYFTGDIKELKTFLSNIGQNLSNQLKPEIDMLFKEVLKVDKNNKASIDSIKLNQKLATLSKSYSDKIANSPLQNSHIEIENCIPLGFTKTMFNVNTLTTKFNTQFKNSKNQVETQSILENFSDELAHQIGDHVQESFIETTFLNPRNDCIIRSCARVMTS